jgi:hypothetical protein
VYVQADYGDEPAIALFLLSRMSRPHARHNAVTTEGVSDRAEKV